MIIGERQLSYLYIIFSYNQMCCYLLVKFSGESWMKVQLCIVCVCLRERREKREKEGETERPFFRQPIMLLKTILFLFNLTYYHLQEQGKELNQFETFSQK